MKSFPNFTSIPFDYLLISWVTNYTHNRQGFDLFIASRTPSIEKFKAHRLAKVHIFLSEIIKKNRVGSFYHALTISCICTDSKIHQTLDFYLKSTKANRLAKVIRILSGKFTESSTTLLHRAKLRRLHKCIQNTHRKRK